MTTEEVEKMAAQLSSNLNSIDASTHTYIVRRLLTDHKERIESEIEDARLRILRTQDDLRILKDMLQDAGVPFSKTVADEG